MLQNKKKIFDEFDELFLRKNYGKMGIFELLNIFNNCRNEDEQVSLHWLRDKLRKIGIYNKNLIHWSEEDTNFLKKNYKKIGDLELSKLLTERKKSYKIIDGKKQYRIFTKKHVEKKRKLLGLKRTDAEVLSVVKRNIANGKWCIKKDDNLYTRGLKKVLEQNEIVLYRTGYFVKQGKKIVPYARWFYQNYIDKNIPLNHRIYYKDGDIFNIEFDNIICIKIGQDKTREFTEQALKCLKIRKIKLSEDWVNGIDKSKENLHKTYSEIEKMKIQNRKDFGRVKKLIEKYEQRLKKYDSNPKGKWNCIFNLRKKGNIIDNKERTIILRRKYPKKTEKKSIKFLENIGFKIIEK